VATSSSVECKKVYDRYGTTEETPETESPAEDPSEYTPKKSDFELPIKTLEKDCFGSAGCLVKVRISVDYVGDSDLPDSGTIELTYEVNEKEGETIGTSELELPEGDYRPVEELIKTRSSGTKVVAKVTEVAYLP